MNNTEFNLENLLNNVMGSWIEIIMNIKHNPKTQDLFNVLFSTLQNDQELFKGQLKILPPKDNIFETFRYFELKNTKCVIIGQDPYHQLGQAHGLSFSVQDNVKHPPSLKNIIKELYLEYPEMLKESISGNLIEWVKQEVLMLNSALTVLESNPNKYQSLWSPITSIIIKELSDKHQGGCIFMLWGNDAKKYKKIIDCNKHHILEANHPSPLSANRGGWFENNHFIKTNDILVKNGKNQIKWI